MISVEDLNILVVEPSATQRRIVSRALKETGAINIYQADNGSNALEELVRLSPDLVISALYLPDMTGTDLVHRIRKLETHASTAFMLISSETRFRYLDPIRQAGAVGILPKPFSTQELNVALATTLDLIDPGNLSLDQQGSSSLQVLVVDDSKLARKHICRVLAGMEIPRENIDTASDGAEALQKINANYYDFVVSDYNMPVMDGVELVDQIRQASNQSSIPVLMVTSETDVNRLAAVQQAGVSAICDKPFEPATVHKLISQFLSA